MPVWDQRREEWGTHSEDARSPYDVDYSRVIHSGSFRRLQGKPQILYLGDSDFYRTRLTHSLEVSQIGIGIVRQLRKFYASHPSNTVLPETTMIEAICLTHDLGHPPFGHGGEVALNYCMRAHGGFEANGQTLRILSKLEKFSKAAGANFTRRTLLGILKYPVRFSSARNPKLIPKLVEGTSATQILDRKASKPPKCYLDSEEDVVEWLLKDFSINDRYQFARMEVAEPDKHRKSIHKSFDCSIMDVADDIAYGVHDLEDAVAVGLVSEGQFREDVDDGVCSKFLDGLKAKYPKETGNNVYDYFVAALFADGGTRKRQIGRLVHHFVTNLEPCEIDDFESPVLRYRVKLKDEVKPFLEALKRFVATQVIRSPNVQQLEFKGQQMVVKVYEALVTDPSSLLPTDTYKRFQAVSDYRVIGDYIAGMTDHFLMRTYDRLYSPRIGSVFDKL